MNRSTGQPLLRIHLPPRALLRTLLLPSARSACLLLAACLARGVLADSGRPEVLGNEHSQGSVAVRGEAKRAQAKDPQRLAALIFQDVWQSLAVEKGGEEHLAFPKEIIWLNGAPGAGKTTNTGFIRQERSILAEPLVVSSLLSTPQMQQIMSQGFLVGDRQVTEMVFEALLLPQYQAGVIVDGYPRTMAQAAICRMLHDMMNALHRRHKGTALADRFLRPVFRIVVLYVDEPTSIERQLNRAKKVEAYNTRVRETGVGELQEVRSTDQDEALTRRRYRTFIEQTYEALKSLGTLFVYNLINAGGTMDEVQKNIEAEMEYQSSIELNPETFSTVSQLELASEITMNARQRLVRRMDDYALKSPRAFKEVAAALKSEIYPVIHMHAISGRCAHVTHAPVFLDDLSLQMAIDILSERGFRVTSEPVVRGTKLFISWNPPDKLGSTRLEDPAKMAELRAQHAELSSQSAEVVPTRPTKLQYEASPMNPQAEL